MDYFTLNDGVKMPALGFGVFQIDDLAECKKVVVQAIKAGYRLFDTAQAYGNEKAVGEAIKESGIPRDQFFITSKLWITHTQGNDPVQAIDDSLKQLGTDYLDLYLIHMPYGDTFNAWRDMEKAQAAGKIRAIGVSNFYPDQITNLELFNKVKPAVNQIEVNPWNQQVRDVAFNQNNGLQVEAWAPFAEGKGGVFVNPVLGKIAQAHGKKTGQVILRWLIQRGIVVIPKSVHVARMQENINVFDFKLTKQEMEEISSLNMGQSQFFDRRDPEAIKTVVSGGRPGANQK